jgi:hypothetical protein
MGGCLGLLGFESAKEARWTRFGSPAFGFWDSSFLRRT